VEDLEDGRAGLVVDRRQQPVLGDEVGERNLAAPQPLVALPSHDKDLVVEQNLHINVRL